MKTTAPAGICQEIVRGRFRSYCGIGLNRFRCNQPSVHLEITVLEGYYAGLVPVFVAQIKQQECRNHQIAGDEVEPGEYRCLEHADVCAEQHHHEQDHREPRPIRVELGLEFQIVEAAALGDPGLAKTQMADGYT